MQFGSEKLGLQQFPAQLLLLLIVLLFFSLCCKYLSVDLSSLFWWLWRFCCDRCPGLSLPRDIQQIKWHWGPSHGPIGQFTAPAAEPVAATTATETKANCDNKKKKKRKYQRRVKT
jgi:hypothetical protein